MNLLRPSDLCWLRTMIDDENDEKFKLCVLLEPEFNLTDTGSLDRCRVDKILRLVSSLVSTHHDHFLSDEGAKNDKSRIRLRGVDITVSSSPSGPECHFSEDPPSSPSSAPSRRGPFNHPRDEDRSRNEYSSPIATKISKPGAHVKTDILESDVECNYLRPFQIRHRQKLVLA